LKSPVAGLNINYKNVQSNSLVQYENVFEDSELTQTSISILFEIQKKTVAIVVDYESR